MCTVCGSCSCFLPTPIISSGLQINRVEKVFQQRGKFILQATDIYHTIPCTVNCFCPATLYSSLWIMYSFQFATPQGNKLWDLKSVIIKTAAECRRVYTLWLCPCTSNPENTAPCLQSNRIHTPNFVDTTSADVCTLQHGLKTDIR